MSLWDVDKTGDNRMRPMLNAGDNLSAGALKAHATEGIAYRTEDSTRAPSVKTKDDQIIVDDGTNARIVIGRIGDDYAAVIVKEGYDAFESVQS